MADVNVENNNDDRSHNSDHLIIDVDVVEPRLEEEEQDDEDPEEEVQEIGADVESGVVTTAGDGVVSTTGGWAMSTAGAGAIITAGAGSVTVCGGTGGGGINTSGAGSVKTYTGVSAAKNSNVEEDCAEKLPWMVGVLGGLADGTATAAALYKSPRGVAAHGGEVAYRVGLASVFVAGVAEMVAAFWVHGDSQKRGATEKKILYVAICTLLLGIALDGVAIVQKN